MKIFVSSTFEDLREHRNAAIRVLRQLGHEVLAMEDYVAASALPLQKVLDDVRRCDLYAGIFAWRYGYVPPSSPATPVVAGAVAGSTSITEYEYLQAKQAQKPVLAFLLDEREPWPPHLVDGFAEGKEGTRIRQLRQQLQQERIVSYFTRPEDLEARVGAAVTTEGMTRQVRLNLIRPMAPQVLSAVANAPVVPEGSRADELWTGIVSARNERVVAIDVCTDWWSTRLCLLAVLSEELTQIRRILVVEGSDFVGLLSTQTVRSTLPRRYAPLLQFEDQVVLRRRNAHTDIAAEARELLELWKNAFANQPEPQVKEMVTASSPERCFGEAMIRHPLRVVDLEQASVLDLARMLDYPGDFVPLVGERGFPETDGWEARIVVVEKGTLNARLARSYVGEMLDRLGFPQ